MEKTIVPPNIAAFDSNLIKFPCVFLLRFSFDLRINRTVLAGRKVHEYPHP